MSNSNIVYLFIHIYSYLNFLSDSILLCRLHKNSDSSMKSVIVTWLFCGRCLATLVKIIPMEIFLDFLFRFFFFFSICFLQFKIYIVSLRTFCDAQLHSKIRSDSLNHSEDHLSRSTFPVSHRIFRTSIVA